jgi:hypothetical protein
VIQIEAEHAFQTTQPAPSLRRHCDRAAGEPPTGKSDNSRACELSAQLRYRRLCAGCIGGDPRTTNRPEPVALELPSLVDNRDTCESDQLTDVGSCLKTNGRGDYKELMLVTGSATCRGRNRARRSTFP